jgi:capsular polysaccharide biosynthesis protein
MLEDEIELIDYLKVLWKRKILIIVVTLVGMVLVIVWNLSLIETYRSEAIINIGKVARPGPNSFSDIAPLLPIDTSSNLVETIPILYGIANGSECVLYAEKIGNTSLIRLIVKGSDRRTKELLEEVIDRIISDHHETSNTSIATYITLSKKLAENAKKLEENAKELQARIALSEIYRNADKSLEVDPNLRIALENQIIVKESRVTRTYDTVRSIKHQILIYRIFIDSFDEYTEQIGEVRNTTIRPSWKRNTVFVGVVCLIMSFFLAFFVEYLVNAVERAEKKK